MITNTAARDAVTEKRKAQKKTEKRLAKLTAQPEARLVTVSQDGNLILTGNRDLVAEYYILSSPRGTFAKANQCRWQPKGQDTSLPVEIGVLTGTNCFLRVDAQDLPGVFFNKKHSPGDGQLLLLFLWTTKFAELFAITPTTQSMFHILRPSDEGLLLQGLCLDLLKAHKPTEHKELMQFLAEVVVRG